MQIPITAADVFLLSVSQVDDAKYQRIMDFLNWYASPEGLNYQHIGLKGFNYTVGSDGKYTFINDNALMDNITVPDEFGGGGYNDGNNAINQWMVDAISTNPATGEPYNKDYWSTYKAATMTQMKKDWAAKFGAAEPVDYMKKNNILLISPMSAYPFQVIRLIYPLSANSAAIYSVIIPGE